MCKIIHLQPGYTPPFEMIQMATWNNPHGYGLILKDKKAKKLQLIKSGKHSLENGNDPKEVYDLLKDNEDLERYIHLRWKTEGDISEDNIQPFCVYNSSKRTVFFMHNGTLHDYRPPSGYVTYNNGVRVESPDNSGKSKWSDTRRFAEEFLSPLMVRFKGENGLGDIQDEVFHQMVNKFFGSAVHNRGILISSDQEPYYINRTNWSKISKDGHEFLASNNTYFETLSRGPMFEKKKKEEEEAKKARFQENSSNNNTKIDKSESPTITKLKDIFLDDKLKLPVNIKSILYDTDLYSHKGLSNLKNVTFAEWDTFSGNKEDAISLFMHLTDEFAVLHEKYQKLVTHYEATKEKEVRVG